MSFWPSIPLARRVFFRPNRKEYLAQKRSLGPEEVCPFCLAAKSLAPNPETLCLRQTAFSQIVMNKYPYNSGHLLVLPRRHVGSYFELSEEEFSDLHTELRRAMKAVQNAYSPAGFNVGLNQGAAAGAGIPQHLHYHLIPRWSGDLNFFPLTANTKVVIEELETTFDRLLAYLK